jgi:hypothetical protein
MVKKITFLSLFLLLIIAQPVLAAPSFYWKPEIVYPVIGGQKISATSTLTDYIVYIFNFAILISILIAIISLTYGGFLYLTSGDNPQSLNNAKSQIWASFLGLFILLFSHLLLTILNPTLTIVQLPTTIEEAINLDEGVKIWNVNSPDNFKITRVSIPNIEELYGPDFQPNGIQILNPWVGKVKVLVFDDINYQGRSVEIKNGDEQYVSFTIKSLKIVATGSGVYLYAGISNGREAGMYYKPYLFPNPAIQNDDFRPGKFLVAPWSFNVKMKYSTSAPDIRVRLYSATTCTGTSISVSSSRSNIGGTYKCADIISCPPGTEIANSAVARCFLKVTLYSGRNFSGFRTNNIQAGTNRGLKITDTQSQILPIKSVKIETKEVSPVYATSICPGILHEIPLQATMTDIRLPNYSPPPKCFFFLPYYSNPTNLPKEFKGWFYRVSNPEPKYGPELYLSKSEPNLLKSAPNINDKVMYLKLVDTRDANGTKITNYGTILFEDPYYTGNFKIFIPKDLGGEVQDPESGTKLMAWLHPKFYSWWAGPIFLSGTPENEIKDLKSNWGQVRKVSSALVFSVKPQYCIIKLYRDPHYNGPYCRIMINESNYQQFLSPKWIDSDDVCHKQGMQFDQNDNQLTNLIKFEDNVRSIRIEGGGGGGAPGNCIVALTELRPKTTATDNLEDDYPGNLSSVFLKSDDDFSNDPIQQCARWRFFNIKGVAPCASGIAIIPYDPKYEP